jgi:hypothetical protein
MAQGHFDFEQVLDEEEELDYDHLCPCPRCKKDIPANATMCLYCSAEVTRQTRPGWVIWTAIGLLAAFVLAGIFL